MEKHTLRVEKPTILYQSVPRIHEEAGNLYFDSFLLICISFVVRTRGIVCVVYLLFRLANCKDPCKRCVLAPKKKRSQNFKLKKVNQLDDHTESSYSSEEEILSVSLDNNANTVDMSKFKNKIFAHMEITHALEKMQVDSRASCNILPGKFLPRDTEIILRRPTWS